MRAVHMDADVLRPRHSRADGCVTHTWSVARAPFLTGPDDSTWQGSRPEVTAICLCPTSALKQRQETKGQQGPCSSFTPMKSRFPGLKGTEAAMTLLFSLSSRRQRTSFSVVLFLLNLKPLRDRGGGAFLWYLCPCECVRLAGPQPLSCQTLQFL